MALEEFLGREASSNTNVVVGGRRGETRKAEDVAEGGEPREVVFVNRNSVVGFGGNWHRNSPANRKSLESLDQTGSRTGQGNGAGGVAGAVKSWREGIGDRGF